MVNKTHKKLRNELRNYHFFVSKKLVIRLMKLMAIETIYPNIFNTDQAV